MLWSDLSDLLHKIASTVSQWFVRTKSAFCRRVVGGYKSGNISVVNSLALNLEALKTFLKMETRLCLNYLH